MRWLVIGALLGAIPGAALAQSVDAGPPGRVSARAAGPEASPDRRLCCALSFEHPVRWARWLALRPLEVTLLRKLPRVELERTAHDRELSLPLSTRVVLTGRYRDKVDREQDMVPEGVQLSLGFLF